MVLPERALSGCRVLVVDDRADVRDAIRVVLAQHDATVTVAASAEDALTVLSSRHPGTDVVVTDFSLLGARHDGVWLLKQIRATWGNAIAVILVTGFDERERELSRLGFDGVIFKPLNTQELVALVAGARDARRPQSA